MPIDPRENIFKDLRMFQFPSFQSYDEFLNLAYAFCQDTRGKKESKSEKELWNIEMDFCEAFSSLDEVPELGWILLWMDQAVANGLSEVKTGSRYDRVHLNLADARMLLQTFKRRVWKVVNAHRKNVRIVNQELI